MSLPIIAIILTILGGFALLAYLVKRWLSEFAEQQSSADELLKVIKLLQEGSKEDRKVLLTSLQKNTQALNERLDRAAEVIGRVQRSIGEMSEIGREIKKLQEFLRSPKLRGNIGEQVLRELLTQLLPKQKFHLQYSFSSGVTVDAAIQTTNGIIPIDSKFPMENFKKMVAAENEQQREQLRREFINDVRRHIRDISNKYILTEEGTIDYALMYIPSEAIYYEVVNEPKLFDYAGERRVLPVSPTTFYAYLKAILMSFEGQKIEHQAKLILASLNALQKDYEKVEDGLSTLQRHINNTYNMMSNVMVRFGQLGQRLRNTRELKGEQRLIT